MTRRWLQVDGTSDVGKSSLVRAGLIQAVRVGWLEETSPGEWTMLTLRPGAKPLHALAAVLERVLTGKAETGTPVTRLDGLKDPEGTDPDDLAEAEWEYAARAATRMAYWWGGDIR